MSNSDNAARPIGTFAGNINAVLHEELAAHPNLMLGGQLIKFGFAGLTTGLYEKYPERFITYPVCEELMNSSAMGLALAGKRVLMFHVRMDFLLCGMNALFNHIPIWRKKGYKLPITFIVQKGGDRVLGQGAQHSKDLTAWFQMCEGWRTMVPDSPQAAGTMLREAINGDDPTMFVLHRRLFNSAEGEKLEVPQEIKMVGASRRHVEEFYGG